MFLEAYSFKKLCQKFHKKKKKREEEPVLRRQDHRMRHEVLSLPPPSFLCPSLSFLSSWEKHAFCLAGERERELRFCLPAMLLVGPFLPSSFSSRDICHTHVMPIFLFAASCFSFLIEYVVHRHNFSSSMAGRACCTEHRHAQNRSFVLYQIISGRISLSKRVEF